MSESQINDLTVSSDMIVNGYAYSRLGENVRVVNMNTGNAAVMLHDGTIIEASMDDIELDIAQNYFLHNSRFMAVANA